MPSRLLHDAQQGDQRAFDAVFATFQPGLLRYLTGTAPALADDVASATWESVASSLHRFRGDGDDFRRWIFTIARRRLVDEYRRSSRRPKTHDAPIELPSEDPGPEQCWEGQDWAAWALRQIPARHADVIALRVLGGLTVAETSALLGISNENVRVLAHRGLQGIRQLLDADMKAATGQPIDEPGKSPRSV